MPGDVIFRLSPGGGPPPEVEIIFHAQRAQEYGHTWIGLHRPKTNQQLNKEINYGASHVYIITSEARHRKTVLRGIVREVTHVRPDDEFLGDIYRGHDFQSWWRIDSVECVVVPDFDALKLRKSIDNAPYDTAWLSKRQSFNYLKQGNAWPANAIHAFDTADLVEEYNGISEIVAPQITKEHPVFIAPKPLSSVSTPPGSVVHAVDWSGGGEFATVNPKIRYARWDFTSTGSTVSVLPATLSRREILRMIREMPGIWILDFPFGLPVELMRRACKNLNSLDAVLAFTRGVQKHDFRDHCNAVWARGQLASKHRATERAVGCGWFDWFIQLFRQTWTGQVEILSALRESGDPAAILPWDYDRNVGILIVEGFPGASLRQHQLPAQGYKHPGNHSQGIRARIVAGLVACGLPLTASVTAEAIADTTGDLIDALAMLLAGRDALATNHVAIRAELHQRGLLGEGWIYR